MHPKNPKKLPGGQKHSPPDKIYEAGPAKPNREIEEELRIQAMRFSGPLPHPDTLREYDALVPGAARDIIQSFVKEGDQRRALQERETAMCELWARDDIKLQKRGQVFGFILGLIGIGGGLVAGVMGASATGAIVGGGSLAAIIIAFLRPRHLKELGGGDDSGDKGQVEKKA
jgi:uncharacterized membrane protein